MVNVLERQINQEDVDTIVAALPEHITSFTYYKRGKHFFEPEVIRRLKDNGYDINAVAVAELGKTLNELGRYPDDLPRIYNYVLPSLRNTHFHNIDYKTQVQTKLVGKPTIVDGSLVKMEWFADVEQTLKILKVEFEYTRDELTRLYLSRTETRTWINGDGSENVLQKVWLKDYTLDSIGQFEASKRRRENVIYTLQVQVVYFLIVNQVAENQQKAIETGSIFLQDYLIQVDSYKSAPDLRFFQLKLESESPETTSYPWLFGNVPGSQITIRDYLIMKLDA